MFQKISQTRVGIETYGGDVAVPLTPFHNPDGGCAEPFNRRTERHPAGQLPQHAGPGCPGCGLPGRVLDPCEPGAVQKPVDTSACGGFAVGNHLLAMQMGLDSPLERADHRPGKTDGLTYSTANQGNYYYSKVLLFHRTASQRVPEGAYGPAGHGAGYGGGPEQGSGAHAGDRDFTVYDEIDGHFYPTHEFSQEPSSL